MDFWSADSLATLADWWFSTTSQRLPPLCPRLCLPHSLMALCSLPLSYRGKICVQLCPPLAYWAKTGPRNYVLSKPQKMFTTLRLSSHHEACLGGKAGGVALHMWAARLSQSGRTAPHLTISFERWNKFSVKSIYTGAKSTAWVQIPALLVTVCVILTELLYFYASVSPPVQWE